MQENFGVGKVYDFEVLDVLESGYGKKYISLKRGERETYRVSPFPFQEEVENLPRTMKCKVKQIDIMHGLPILEQDMYSLLSDLYVVSEYYPFKVISEAKYDKNEHTYFRIKDDYGISHNYYPTKNETIELNDIFSLEIKEICTTGFLKFEYREQVKPDIEIKTVKELDKPIESSTSDFGHEDGYTEFKSSIVFKAGSTEPDIKNQLFVIIKTIAGFMNADGGVLYIGVNDNGYVTGISSDLLHLNTDDSNGYTYKQDTDGYEQRIRNAVKEQIGVFPNGELKFNFYKSNTNEVYCAVQIPAISRPVYVNETRLYQRAGIQTQILKGDDITKYIEKRLSVSKLSPLVEQAVPKTEVGSVEIEKGENNIPVVAPLLVASKPLNEKIWKYFTWYSNGDWSFQSTASKENDVMKEIAIYPSQKDMRLLMCYSSGHINPIIPKKVASKKSSGKRYKNGWHSGATLLDIFLAQPYDLIATYSKSIEDTEMIKVHSVDHFNPKDSIQAAGPTIVNDRLGTLLKYKLIDVVNKQGILGLLETKARTSTSLGVRITSLPHKAEIRFLEEL